MLQLPFARPVGNLTVALEPYLWDALEDIALRERSSVEALCASVLDRLTERQRRHGDVADLPAALASALRVLPAAYYRHAAALSAQPISGNATARRTATAPTSEVLHSEPDAATAKSAYTRMQPRSLT